MKKFVVYLCDDFWVEDNVLKIHNPKIRFMSDEAENVKNYIAESFENAIVCPALYEPFKDVEFTYN